MRFSTPRLTIALATIALGGLTVFAQTPPAPTPCVTSIPGLSDAPVMLSHIDDILNDALKKTPVVTRAMTSGSVGTNGGAVIKVAIDRDKIDEIRAEIAHLKVILKK
jgi:hypothetical protein